MSESSFEEEPPIVKSHVFEPTGDTGGDTGSTSSGDDKIVTREENRAVYISKFTVLLVICVTAAAFGAVTYVFTSNEEEDDFESQFNDFAHEVIAIAHEEAKSVFGLLGTLATTLSSYTIDQKLHWPNVSLPHFEHRGNANNELSRALQISLVPLLKREEKVEWEEYAQQNQGWVQEGVLASPELHEDFLGPDLKVPPIPSQVWRFESGVNGTAVPEDGPGITEFGPGNYGVVWQQAPAPHDTSIINFDILSHPTFARIYHGMWETAQAVLSEVTDMSFLYEGAVKDDITHPHSFLMQPIYPNFEEAHDTHKDDLLGFIVAVLPWDKYFLNLLPVHIKGIVVVLHNTCGDHYTYKISGAEAFFMGKGDLHDRHYNRLEVQSPFADFLLVDVSEIHDHCEYDLRVYPSREFEDHYKSNKPWLYTVVVVAVFLLTALVFLLYDYMVARRNSKVVNKARKTNAIVAALFPSNVRDRILQDVEAQAELEERKNKKFTFAAQKDQLKTFLDDEEEHAVAQPYGTKPIADLFPSATVMFADIVGFTAWSSVREPSQVFTLLETVYHAFDEIAKRRKVFKVETVGDCYVAVVGLPDPRPDHPVVMARFARECLEKMNQLTKQLETSLGPDTGDLSMRIGIHSGPVTAGVLRGDKSRFQLFGDTVNTAARIEATGERNRIHLSLETANLLIAARKGHWVNQRTDIVQAKGKGALETFWLDVHLRSAPSTQSDNDHSNVNLVAEAKEDAKFIQAKPKVPTDDEKHNRLIGWNIDVLGRLIKQIIARRNAAARLGRSKRSPSRIAVPFEQDDTNPTMVLDEVKEIIRLPAFDPLVVENQEDPNSIELNQDINDQLRSFIGTVAAMYRDNPFHNFEHASHVTMSVVKLLSRIVTADALMEKQKDGNQEDIHDFTFGITSDPLTQFACVFAALIHDCDHCGVPNTQLIKENTHLAQLYKNKSIAEQNSVDLAWDLFLDGEYAGLRQVICPTDDEMKRFRELVVNSVMATDIMDKDLKILRNARWDKAFSEAATTDSASDAVNRKATIVIEHLIQASDVAHTMQHWHIYRKWNERLFHELLLAYRNGRAEKDPAEFWYKGELGFFDFYIIPLAKKLKDCGVFGVSSDEYLNYAEKNRREWESKGQEVVESMVDKHMELYPMEEPEDSDKASMLRWESQVPVQPIKEEEVTDEPRSRSLGTSERVFT